MAVVVQLRVKINVRNYAKENVLDVVEDAKMHVVVAVRWNVAMTVKMTASTNAWQPRLKL